MILDTYICFVILKLGQTYFLKNVLLIYGENIQNNFLAFEICSIASLSLVTLTCKYSLELLILV